jgi:hypothetical protein
MKFALTPIRSLRLLVVIQALLLLLLLGTHLRIQSQNNRLLDQRGQILARLPDVRQKIHDEPDPEKIRSESLRLLDLADQGNQAIVAMSVNLQKMTDAIGLVLFVLTAYLAVGVYKLRRQDQHAAPLPK